MQLLHVSVKTVRKFLNLTHDKLFSTSAVRQKKCVESEFFQDKVALVTGGASGIGFETIKALLCRGIRAVTIADVCEAKGEVALKYIAQNYGNNKALFVECDVSKPDYIDWAFKNTLSCFGNVDIVVHNGGVIDDKEWEYELAANVHGSVATNLLALQYMSSTCRGQGGVIINVMSTMALQPLSGCPIYSMTQGGILNLTRALGDGSLFDRTGVKVIGLMAGCTETESLLNSCNNMLNEKFKEEYCEELREITLQTPGCVGCAVAHVVENGEPGSVWVSSDCEPPYEIEFPDCLDALKLEAVEAAEEDDENVKAEKEHFCEMFDVACNCNQTQTCGKDCKNRRCVDVDAPSSLFTKCDYGEAIKNKTAEDVLKCFKKEKKYFR